MKQTLEERVERLEEEIALYRKYARAKEWYPLQEAAEIIGCSVYFLRTQIKSAQIAPRLSPYKQGTHWRLPGKRGYQINIVNWMKVN